jgi:hypothetical protein
VPAFDYAVLRIVPHVEREEFVNVGVILHCPAAAFLSCEASVDLARLRALAPSLDPALVCRHLDAFRAICLGDPTAGPIASLPLGERFHWLVAPRSTILQTSPVHGGIADDPATALRDLFARRVASRQSSER